MRLREVGREILERHKPYAVGLGKPGAMDRIKDRGGGIALAFVVRAEDVEAIGDVDGHAVTISPLAERSLHRPLLVNIGRLVQRPKPNGCRVRCGHAFPQSLDLWRIRPHELQSLGRPR